MANEKQSKPKPGRDPEKILSVPTDTTSRALLETHKSRQRAKGDSSLSISPQFVLRAIGQWWKIATPAGVLLACLAAAAVLWTSRPVYRASALIQIKDMQPYIANRPGNDGKRFAETQIQLLRSPIVLGPVLSDPEVAALDVMQNRAGGETEYLADCIQVQSVGNSELYEVSCTSPDSHSATVIANAVVDSFFRLHTEHENQQAHRVIELLNEEKKRRAHEVEALRERVRELSKTVLGRDPFTGHATPNIVLLNQPLEGLHQQLSQTEVDRQILEAQVTAFEESLEKGEVTVPELMIEQAFRQSPEAASVYTELTVRRGHLRGIASRSPNGKNDPWYGREAQRVRELESSLNELREILRPQLEKDLLTAALAQRQSELKSMQQSLDKQRLTEDLLRNKYTDLIKQAGENSTDSVELEFARAELMQQEEVYQKIAERALQLTTEMRAPPRVTPRQAAEEPGSPIPSSTPRKVMLAMLVSFCLPFGIAVVWERFVRRIGDSTELEAQADLGVVAEIARLPMRARINGHNYTGSSGRALSVFEESIDSLRTTLLLSDNENLQVVTVASAVPAEGKTSVASQLAVSIARSAGGPVLLIDADMRSPDIHRIFQVKNEPGLAELLDGECRLEDVIDTSWSDHVHLLPAGRLHKSPHHLVGTGELEKLLKQVRSMYRRIVIDVPPVLSASESLVLAKASDGVLICAMQDYSRSNQVRLAYQRLEASGAHMLGAVLNGVSPRKYTFTYGKYSYGYQQSANGA